MELSTLLLKEETGRPRRSEPIRAGVPLPKGALFPGGALCLREPSGTPIQPLQSRPLGYWDDGSVHWLLVDFPINLEPGESKTLTLTHSPDSEPCGSLDVVRDPEKQCLIVTTPDLCLEALPDQGRWRVKRNDGDWQLHTLELTSASGSPCEARITSSWELVDRGPLFAELRVQGQWTDIDSTALGHFTARLTIFSVNQLVKLDLTIHNPRRALHPGGLWDLGDAGSLYFRSLSLNVDQPNGHTAWIRAEDGAEPDTASGTQHLRLYQDSSGGEHWNSRSHQDAQGRVIPAFRGYRVFRDDDVIRHANRATPVAGISGHQASTCVSLRRFWQNFPSALQCSGSRLSVDFFPPDAQSPYELQGGERKAQTAWIHYGDQWELLTNLEHSVLPRVPAERYQACQAFPCFAADAEPDALDRLIEKSLAPDTGFFSKRETIDEFGWRNFGDIVADHESLYLAHGQSPYISHYNNQYDAIFGFARQFAKTGDRRWFELMDDLACHVADIDIYHTDEDRAEYNHGLFWHTDHYLDAYTATHRTYSRFNSTSSIPGQTGGGPAAEHCYTTGLLYHHWLTGSPHSRSAVLELATWIQNAHEGSAGFLAQILAIKKQEIPRLRKVLRHNQTGIYRYPFTRGTGNYVNTLLDASLLQPESHWLETAERVIRSTIGPQDDIGQRHLLDAETGWSYLVLLAALTRYLWVKLDRGETDHHYHYALASLRHYWRWMAENERPFMDNPDQLEFPNHTWVAQDFRKAVLLYQAAAFDPAWRDRYQTRARDWLQYVVTTLEHSEECGFSRIQIILLQNYGAHQWVPELPAAATADMPVSSGEMTGQLSALTKIMGHILHRVWKGVVAFRPSRERAWLKSRLEA
ncbi:MAG TPA: hypothetical protein VFM78_09125 [Marinobacter sp.]|nr:hypothetical protein [Marinobacter sp.]